MTSWQYVHWIVGGRAEMGVCVGGVAKLNRMKKIGGGAEGFFLNFFFFSFKRVLRWRGGVAQRKHSNGNQQDLVLIFSFVWMFFVCFLITSEAPLTLRRRGGWPWFYPNTTLHTFVSIPELFCCTCRERNTEKVLSYLTILSTSTTRSTALVSFMLWWYSLPNARCKL